MAEDKNGPDATPRIGLDLGRQVFDPPNEDMIRQRAHEIWEREGRSGDPQDHWFQAERELSGGSTDRSEATVENAPPVTAVDAAEEIGSSGSETGEQNRS